MSNKRQKKKLYKRLVSRNPPKWMRYKGEIYHIVVNKPWGGGKGVSAVTGIGQTGEF